MDRRVVGCLIGLAPFMGGQRRFRSNWLFWNTQARPQPDALGETAPDSDASGLHLVATWQRGDLHRARGRKQSESDVCLHAGTERLHEHQAAAYPTLVATEPGCDGALPQRVVAVQRPDDPRFLERRQAASVKLTHVYGGINGVHVVDEHAQVA